MGSLKDRVILNFIGELFSVISFGILSTISQKSFENFSISHSVKLHILENDLARPLKSSSVIIALKSNDQSIIELYISTSLLAA